MPNVIVASTLPVAVLLKGTSHPVGIEPYSIEIAGERSPTAVNGTGITYDVDETAFDEWMGTNVGLADSVRLITPEEIEELALAEGTYGYEAGLEDVENGGTLVAENLSLGAARTIEQTAAQRVRSASAQIREADATRKNADMQTEAAQAELQAAEEQQKQAMAIIEERTEAQNKLEARQRPQPQSGQMPGPGEPGYVPPPAA